MHVSGRKVLDRKQQVQMSWGRSTLGTLRVRKLVGVPWSEQEEEQEERRSV